MNLMMRGDGQEMKQIVEVLSQLTGRSVRDKTGLTGRYDFDMKMDLQAVLALAQRMGANIPAAAANIPQSDGSSLMTALNEQLGLKLDSVRAPSTSWSSIASRHQPPTSAGSGLAGVYTKRDSAWDRRLSTSTTSRDRSAARPRSRACPSTPPRARSTASSAPTAPARRRSSSTCSGCCAPPPARCASSASTRFATRSACWAASATSPRNASCRSGCASTS